jgi:hypothetical protein
VRALWVQILLRFWGAVSASGRRPVAKTSCPPRPRSGRAAEGRPMGCKGWGESTYGGSGRSSSDTSCLCSLFSLLHSVALLIFSHSLVLCCSLSRSSQDLTLLSRQVSMQTCVRASRFPLQLLLKWAGKVWLSSDGKPQYVETLSKINQPLTLSRTMGTRTGGEIPRRAGICLAELTDVQVDAVSQRVDGGGCLRRVAEPST